MSKAIQALLEITEEAHALLEAKDSDYREAWNYARAESHIDRILQKLLRVRQLQSLESQGKTSQVSEGIESELVDIVNYAAFALYTIRHGYTPDEQILQENN